MKVAEAVDFMTKAYLHRIIDSFTKDLPKPDLDRSREIILRNSQELTDPERIELSRKGWSKLLTNLTNQQLKTILNEAGLPKYGTKEELAERVVAAGLRPSDALDSLTSDDLYDVCSSLLGAKVSGTKDEELQRIIDYFDKLVVKEVSDREIDNAFEEGIRLLQGEARPRARTHGRLRPSGRLFRDR